MRGLFRRYLVAMLALTFAASGIAARQCDAAHHTMVPPVPAQYVVVDGNGHDHSSLHGKNAQNFDGAKAHVHGLGTPSPVTGDHALAKCSGICALVATVMPDARAASAFSFSLASFSDKLEYWSGAIVSVDPRVPRRII